MEMERLDEEAEEEEEEDEFAEHRHRPSSSTVRPAPGITETRSRSVDVQRRHHARPPKADSNKPGNRRLRGELNIRVVDFAHTTTGADFTPLLPGSEDVSVLGKGYDSHIDATTGLATARFPPKHSKEPDMGFIFGLKSICAALREIWEDEMVDQGKEGAEVDVEVGLVVKENENVFERVWDEGELST